jgi:hypothetical protein
VGLAMTIKQRNERQKVTQTSILQRTQIRNRSSNNTQGKTGKRTEGNGKGIGKKGRNKEKEVEKGKKR